MLRRALTTSLYSRFERTCLATVEWPQDDFRSEPVREGSIDDGVLEATQISESSTC